MKKTQWTSAAELDSYGISWTGDRHINIILVLPRYAMSGHNQNYSIKGVNRILMTVSASLRRVPYDKRRAY
jgi:hypothetical protein